jgi:hypothetical protein
MCVSCGAALVLLVFQWELALGLLSGVSLCNTSSTLIILEALIERTTLFAAQVL